MATPPQHPNPFRIHGVVTKQYFTDRAKELDKVLGTLREPGAKLLVYGPRRMGKTSVLAQAIVRREKEGGVAFLADLSTASTVVDVANRILEAATRAVGKRWKDAVTDFVARMGMSISLAPDPATGLILPSLDVALRSAALEDQRKSLTAALDSVDALAKSRGKTVGVMLDEFQEIRKFGGESAEWHLRGVIQHHQNVSYVLAGSQAHIIESMLDKGRAFYGLLDQLVFGAMDADHLSRWIDERMADAGVRATGVGKCAVQSAGPRTRDIVQLARRCFDNVRGSRVVTAKDVTEAFDDVVAEQEPLLWSSWEGLTAQQQNVLRAVAVNREGLTTGESMRRFGLPSTGSTTNTAAALVESGVLLRTATATGYGFDNPYFGRWVAMNTLGDIGLNAR